MSESNTVLTMKLQYIECVSSLQPFISLQQLILIIDQAYIYIYIYILYSIADRIEQKHLEGPAAYRI